MNFLILVLFILLVVTAAVKNSCNNGIKDANEADVDCGNSCFSLCDIGMRCDVDFDCNSWKCHEGKCSEDQQSIRFLSASGGSGASGPGYTTTTTTPFPLQTTRAPAKKTTTLALLSTAETINISIVAASFMSLLCVLTL
jgi:hypothetical protein